MSVQGSNRALLIDQCSPLADSHRRFGSCRTCFLQISFVLTTAFVWTGVGSAQESEPQYIREYRQKGLPPVGNHIEFEDHGAFPPLPKGMRQTVGARPEVRADNRKPIERLISESRDVALRDRRVRSALGERFAALGGGPVEPKKDSEAPAVPQTKLDFYSYSNNRAVTVLLVSGRVVSVTTRPEGFQPPETREEVAAAAEIVKRDPRFAAMVKDLRVRGIESSQPSGNRQLSLFFYRDEGSPAVFVAMVDMTSARILNAKAVKP